jgi:hypothetical protein
MSRRRPPASTLPSRKPAKRPRTPPPPATRRTAPPARQKPPLRPPPPRPPHRQVAHIVDEGERTLVDVLDGLLNNGVVLNADLVLALADVDLVYVRLSALLCAADRILSSER